MLSRKGQSIAEYAILIGLVIAAATAMQTYVKRGIQGRTAEAVDALSTRQFEPNYTQNSAEVRRAERATKDVGERGRITTTSGALEETIKETGATETILAPEE